ncbi:MAG: GTPase ObgE [Planctomycetota bacterium]
MFVDEVKIAVKAGRGGDGCLSFHRAKYVPKGGPDGGNGGNGGSVIIKADRNVGSLLDLRKIQLYKAGSGQPGKGSNKQGPYGEDKVIRVPIGTIIKNLNKDKIVADLTEDQKEEVVASGGKGGRGNKSYATAVNQTPRQFEYGEDGEEFDLHLELKLIADIGLIGLPNAGKSTILSRISSAAPKIADYPFTTLEPQLGLVAGPDLSSLVVADIPGLISGAHNGAGLGIEFLKHIERTKCLAHIVDLVPVDGSDPFENYRIIEGEINSFSTLLAAKKRIIIGNKNDLQGAEEAAEKLEQELNQKVLRISAVTDSNFNKLVYDFFNILKENS